MPSEGGIDPTRELKDRSNTCSDFNALIALGMVPERRQNNVETKVNEVIPPIKEGIEPVILLNPTLRCTNFVKALKVSGIDPFNLLKFSSK